MEFLKSMNEAVLLLPIVAAILIFWPWFALSRRKAQQQLDYLVAHPDEVVSLCRSGPDGDGYDRLHVQTKSGKTLVLLESESDAAEKRLKAALVSSAAQ